MYISAYTYNYDVYFFMCNTFCMICINNKNKDNFSAASSVFLLYLFLMHKDQCPQGDVCSRK